LKSVHLIAIGGAIMHNLAIALKRRGYNVTGSDDAIYDPARGNLEAENLLPTEGWDDSAIHESLDVVILGMHARADNPELLKAQKLGLKIMSFPEFVAAESAQKTRVVVAGSHGKTTTTAMIMHVLSELGVAFDYLVGSSIEGFDLSVKLTDAPLIIIEGDEYLSSPMDLRSKFLWYQPHYSIITGVAYDHINVFPTFDLYIDTFRKYIETHTKGGEYFWFKKDEILADLAQNTAIKNTAYDTPDFVSSKEGSVVTLNHKQHPLYVVGKHNLENMVAAQSVTYDGELLAVFELHTFSSLNAEFLPLYQDAMSSADKAIVFYNDAVFEHKKMEPIEAPFVQNCFGNVEVIHSPNRLADVVNQGFKNGNNILLMSSGKFENAPFSFD